MMSWRTDELEIAVHGCGSTALKVPSSGTVVRECGVFVLKISYQYEPVNDPEIWADIIKGRLRRPTYWR